MKQVKLPPANETIRIRKGKVEYAVMIFILAILKLALIVKANR